LHKLCLKNVNKAFCQKRTFELALNIVSDNVGVEVLPDFVGSLKNKLRDVMSPEGLLPLVEVISKFENHKGQSWPVVKRK
jgi:hypothetical protein